MKGRLCAGGIFILPGGEVVLQRRENVWGINFPGMIHIFGGAADEGENGRQAMEREVIEETALDPKFLADAKHILTFDEIGSFDAQANIVEVYEIPIDHPGRLEVLEGEDHVVLHREMRLNNAPLTELARELLKIYGFKGVESR